MTEVRRIAPSDVDAVVGLVHDLAAHEKAPDECHLTPEQLHAALFGPTPSLYGHVAEVDGAVAGFTLWFLNFSTWRGTHGIYLEDLYVRREHRGSGLGVALLKALAQECVRQGYARLEWSVLRWLTPTIEFYESIGAVPLDEWKTYRLTDEPLRALARRRPPTP
ncbi:GNAT family N-acetyltransferase [Actinophytocola glycyrrhizae]|uniref:GNAT family N-acetyltransferase n=1 Tax=Actinophytocola glycyrrhizae TaxID=2044873 RepID=A0ABV9RW39_9PSEU